MNIARIASRRAAAIAAALLLVPAITSAKDAAPADSATRLFAGTGVVPVDAAKPYRSDDSLVSAVQIGTWQSAVSLRLGRPSAVLADGSWLYRGFATDEGVTRGTLVVRFDHGSVSQLSLVSHRVEAAMLKAPAGEKERTLVASRWPNLP
jgi:hypothetical protein